MSGAGGGWLDRASTSVRRQYTVTLVAAASMFLVLGLVCGIAVISAFVSLRTLSEGALPLQLANKSVMQDITDIETSVRGYTLSGDRDTLRPYINAMNHLPGDQRYFLELARPYPELTETIRDRDQQISTWLREYAQPTAESPDPTTAGRQRFLEGVRLFDAIREADSGIDTKIGEIATAIEARSRSVLFWAFAAVVLLPLVLVMVGTALARKMRQAVVDPLDDVLRVLQRLSKGDLTARAALSGPQEIREIAAALNVLATENLRGRDVEADVRQRLEEIDRVRTELVSTVSHELRTPLTSVQGYLELLEDQLAQTLSPAQRSMLEVVRRNLARLNELITNLLALSRAEEHGLAVEPLDLRAVASEAAGDVRLTAATREIKVKTIQSASPVVVLADRSQIFRAVLNLCSNAVKFSEPGDTVEVRVLQHDGRAVVEVVDEGIGIPSDDLGSVGSRFFRASNASRAEIAGTGLGLRIVQTIADRHGGRLAVDSVEGAGTTATFELPLARSLEDDGATELEAAMIEVGPRD